MTAATAAVRLCIHGRVAPDTDWLARVAIEAADAALTLFGASAQVPDCAHAERRPDLATCDLRAVLRAAAASHPGEHLILLRADAALPPLWYPRLLRALDAPNVLVAAPLDNLDTARSPLPEGTSSELPADAIDALCHLFGRRALLDWADFSPLLSIWHGAHLRRFDAAKVDKYTLPQTLAPLRGVLLDALYVADPAQNLQGPAQPSPGADALPPSPLGELREALGRALVAHASVPEARIGLDDKPVVLHVLHGWGGGAERFVRDLAGADRERHHLILIARGNFDRRRYGEALDLVHGALPLPPLRHLDLPDAIASTSFGNRLYQAFFADILRDYSVDAVVVSSLIGHSLDALRSGLPTTFFIHDFYPLWPLLHRNLDDASVSFDASQLRADLAAADAGFEFAERDADYWLALREAFASALLEANARLIAPTHAALQLFLGLQPRLAPLAQTVIAHGIAPWTSTQTLPLPAPSRRERLRLVVLGRVRRGKAAHLLRELLPDLSAHAELFLLGAGPESAEFFGRSDVHIVLNYRRDELPELLARVAPDAALILPNFAETFSYTLSELMSFGIPVIATRLGALAERIDDGVDGFLVAPTASAVLATIARLHAHRDALDQARARLAKKPPRTLSDMAADYRDLLPRRARAERAPIPDDADPDRIAALTRADVIGSRERQLDAAKTLIATQTQELQRRADWGIELERDVQRARKVIEKNSAQMQQLDAELRERAQHLQRLDAHIDELGSVAKSREQELHALAAHLATLDARIEIQGQHMALMNSQIDERNRHIGVLDAQIIERNANIEALDVQIAHQHAVIQTRTQSAREAVEREELLREQYAQLDFAHGQLRGELDDRTHWAQRLNAELDRLRNSTSWRITRPMRFAMRKLRGARARTDYQLQRVASALKRTRGSLARRGLIGTFRRIGDEFERRRAHLPAPAALAAPPSADFTAFAVPTSLAAPGLVSIVIPVYNKIDYTVACLRSLAEHAGSVPFEVIVVDDGSQDATPQQLAQIEGIRVVRNAENLGFVGSCNAGAQAAHGDYLLFLNNDTVVTAGWLEALVRCLDDEPDAGLVGAKLVYPDGRLQEAGGIVFRDGSGWNYGRFDDPAAPAYEFRREADYCSGAAIMLRRDFFAQLGGFDTRYAPAYYEDTDLAFATRAAGKKVFFEPRAVVVHFEGITSGTDVGAGIKQYQVVNREKFLEKWKEALLYQPAPIDSARLAPAAANFRLPRRALIVDSYTPTPDQDSGSLRMVNIMRLLRGLGYRVSFLPDNQAHAGKYTEALQALGVEALYHPQTDFTAWLKRNGASLDVVILSRHYVANTYIALVRLYAPQARLIFDTVDLHYLREQRTAAMQNRADLARNALSTKASELELMRECDISLVVSPVEQQILAREVPGARIAVLSNVHEIYGLRKPFGERRDLVFVGGFQHPPNIDAVQWFVSEVMPLIRHDAPQIRFHIVGSKATQDVLDLAADDVIVHGFVEDIAPFMDECRLSIAPLRVGAGVKGKVNMAMSYGLPVVATSVAVEGMHVRAGEDVIVADTPADLATAILRVYDNEALWNTLSANGLDNVRAHFSFETAREALKTILG